MASDFGVSDAEQGVAPGGVLLSCFISLSFHPLPQEHIDVLLRKFRFHDALVVPDLVAAAAVAELGAVAGPLRCQVRAAVDTLGFGLPLETLPLLLGQLLDSFHDVYFPVRAEIMESAYLYASSAAL